MANNTNTKNMFMKGDTKEILQLISSTVNDLSEIMSYININSDLALLTDDEKNLLVYGRPTCGIIEPVLTDFVSYLVKTFKDEVSLEIIKAFKLKLTAVTKGESLKESAYTSIAEALSKLKKEEMDSFDKFIESSKKYLDPIKFLNSKIFEFAEGIYPLLSNDEFMEYSEDEAINKVCEILINGLNTHLKLDIDPIKVERENDIIMYSMGYTKIVNDIFSRNYDDLVKYYEKIKDIKNIKGITNDIMRKFRNNTDDIDDAENESPAEENVIDVEPTEATDSVKPVEDKVKNKNNKAEESTNKYLEMFSNMINGAKKEGIKMENVTIKTVERTLENIEKAVIDAMSERKTEAEFGVIVIQTIIETVTGIKAEEYDMSELKIEALVKTSSQMQSIERGEQEKKIVLGIFKLIVESDELYNRGAKNIGDFYDVICNNIVEVEALIMNKLKDSGISLPDEVLEKVREVRPEETGNLDDIKKKYKLAYGVELTSKCYHYLWLGVNDKDFEKMLNQIITGEAYPDKAENDFYIKHKEKVDKQEKQYKIAK